MEHPPLQPDEALLEPWKRAREWWEYSVDLAQRSILFWDCLRERGDNMPGGVVASFFVGIYGGYFGAAQGIILMSLLRRCFHEDLQVLNAIKNVLAAIANLVAGILFVLVAHVAWGAAALIAVGSTVGAQVGAHYGRRLPQEVLRWVVVVYGTIVAVILIIT